MSFSGESDTESTIQTHEEQLCNTFTCQICLDAPTLDVARLMDIHWMENEELLIVLPDGTPYVRCVFNDCKIWFHLKCVHPSFPDESLNIEHFVDLADNGIHCDLCWK